MEPILRFRIRNQTISHINDTFCVVAGSRNYLRAEYEFLTDDWNGVDKTAIFEYSGGVKHIPLKGDGCMIPWEALANPGRMKVSVFGGNLITVNWVPVRVQESGYKDSTPPSGDRLPNYAGATTVLPSFEGQALPTKDTSVSEDIEILPIKVTEVSNPQGGKTISI